jgi:polyhydroxyalkanoate synthesis regulator phasin
MDSLNDLLQKTLYFGAGLASYTIEKIEHLDESVSALQAEVQQTVDELIARGEQVVTQTQQSSAATTAWQVAPLHRRLVMLLNGNETLAKHLVDQTQAQNPDRSPVWVYEKVIHDLERDRGL